jgi:hypothetical protein
VRVLLASLCLAALPSCMNGFLYTHTIRPLTTDLRNTPVVPGPGVQGSLLQFRYSYLDLRGGDNAIGAVAREKGLTRVFYADIETYRILGVFTTSYVRVYGEAAPPASE